MIWLAWFAIALPRASRLSDASIMAPQRVYGAINLYRVYGAITQSILAVVCPEGPEGGRRSVFMPSWVLYGK